MLKSKLDDKSLIKNYMNGDDSSFEVLVNRHKNILFSRVFMIVKDEEIANDIFQDTFIKVINTLKGGRYNEEGKFLPWMLRIAHNLSIDHFRKKKKMPMVRGDEDYDVFATISQDELNIEDALVQGQIMSDVKNLLNHLPLEQRQVVIMRHFQEMSFKEISENLDISINTALGRMRYALINLRKIIEEKRIILTMS